MAVRCPTCHRPLRVLATRAVAEGDAIRRRRECRGCGRRFTTFERRESEPLWVRKRTGGRQPFRPEKLRDSLLRAAHKRPVTPGDVERLVRRIAQDVGDAGGELPAERIGELCLAGLRELDTGAYLQFAGTLPGAIPARLGVGRGEEIAQAPASAAAGSVRGARDHAELPRKAASRRDFDD